MRTILTKTLRFLSISHKWNFTCCYVLCNAHSTELQV